MREEDSKAGAAGVLNFVTGMLVGLVMGSVGGVIWAVKAQLPSSGSKSGSRTPVRGPSALAGGQELKMVLCVNNSLGMGKGKIGAQCAHAAVGIMQKYKADNESLFRLWERYGQPKIALKVQDERVMAELAGQALRIKLPCYIVHDAGKTQIAAGSQTVLAIGPGFKHDIDKITGQLSLL